MSSYFDKASSDVSELKALSDDDFIEHTRQIENKVVRDCLLCSGDREFPDDLRQKIVGEVALHTLGYENTTPVPKAVQYALATRNSRLIMRLHDQFHEVATRRIKTRFGLMLDNPADILRMRDMQLLESNPCTTCGKVEVECDNGKIYAECSCTDGDKRKRWTVDTIPVKG